MNRKQLCMTLGVVVLAGSLAAAQRITTFDAPGAGTGSGQGSSSRKASMAWAQPSAITWMRAGSHTAFCASSGEISLPSALRVQAQLRDRAPLPSASIPNTLVGYYTDSNGAYHGYSRTFLGTITTFDAPGAGTGSDQGTYGYNITARHIAAGYFWGHEQRGTRLSS